MKNLRTLLDTTPCLLAPGVYDCLSAKLAEQSGFAAVAVSGYSVEASLLGKPDLGFTTLTDVAEVADRIASAVSVPVICDADTGYGGVNNVWYTVRRLAKAGVQGIHIEDQASPKKCGGLPGRRVVPVEEMVEKIRAALDARTDRDLIVIARTDAKDSMGMDEAIRRLNRYREAGADVVFAAESYTPEELQRLGREVRGPLAICGGVPGWSGSFETQETYAAWGIKLVLYPFTSLYPAARAMQAIYQRMAAGRGVSRELASETMVDFSWFSEFIGVHTWEARERSFVRE